MDTVLLARQEQKKQGSRGVENTDGDEGDIHQDLNKNCKKNPGHHNFLSIDAFITNGDLPIDFKEKDTMNLIRADSDLMDLAKAMSDLTVHVTVKCVSMQRPATIPGSDKPYSRYEDRGKTMKRFGTGWVTFVDKHPDKYKSATNSSTTETRSAIIYIQTAAHVVYDKAEGDHTTCHLFFDREKTPEACSGVVSLNKMLSVTSNDTEDKCTIQYVTHDLELADRLSKMVDSYDLLVEKVNGKYRSLMSNKNRQPSEAIPHPWQRLTIIVSHPHGCSKKVSVGYCTNMDEREDIWDNLKYNAATCHGSSGARVFVMGRRIEHAHWGDYGGNTSGLGN